MVHCSTAPRTPALPVLRTSVPLHFWPLHPRTTASVHHSIPTNAGLFLAPLRPCTNAILHLITTAYLHHYIPSLLHHCCLAAPLHRCTLAPLHPFITALLHTCIPPSLHSCTTASLHHCTPAPQDQWPLIVNREAAATDVCWEPHYLCSAARRRIFHLILPHLATYSPHHTHHIPFNAMYVSHMTHHTTYTMPHHEPVVHQIHHTHCPVFFILQWPINFHVAVAAIAKN